MIKKIEYESNNYQAINAHVENVIDNEKQLLRIRKFKADRYLYKNIGLLLLTIGIFAILISIAYTIYKKYYGIAPVIQTKIVEVVKEVPVTTTKVIEVTKEIPVPGPEKIIRIPGPRKIVRIPGPEKIVIQKVPMQAYINSKDFVLFDKFNPEDSDINEIIVGKKYKNQNSMFPYEQYCYAIAKPKIQKSIYLSVKKGISNIDWLIDNDKSIEKNIQSKLKKLSREFCKFSLNPPSGNKKYFIPFPKSKTPSAGTTVSGSGFYVNKDGYALTNNHVVKNCNAVWLKENDTIIPASIIKVHAKNDLAIIKVENAVKNYAKFSNYVDPVEDVMAIGYPRVDILGDEIKRNKGSISSLTGIQGDNFSLQHTALIQKGSSGGPLINKKGAIVGVNYAKFIENDLQGIGLAIKSINVIEFLGNSSIDFSLIENNTEKEWLDIFKEAEGFTVRVLCAR